MRKNYREKDREVKRSLKLDKTKWLESIAIEAEEAAQSQYMKTLYGLTKMLCNETTRHNASVLGKDRKLLSNKEEVQKRWTEHFRKILNREQPTNPIRPEEEAGLEFVELIEEIAVSEPTIGEVKYAITKLKNGKAPGTDNITAELLKADAEFPAKRMHELLGKVWNHGTIPHDWKKGIIIKLPKKGNLKECKNSRGITLLSILGKILGRVVVDRIRKKVEERTSWLQERKRNYRTSVYTEKHHIASERFSGNPICTFHRL